MSDRNTKTAERPISSKMILKLLATKHASDVFVSECKDGPTWGSGPYGSHLRMDAWVMKRSWANPLVIVYEAKIARGDFLGDEKWHLYLPYCNEFYFVCPTGLLAVEELPAEAGLLYVSRTGSRLYLKKKAQRRTVEIPEALYRYILMSRSRIDPEHEIDKNPGGTAQYWREWLAQKGDNRKLGYEVSTAIRRKVAAVEAENRRLRDENAGVAETKAALEALGIESSRHASTWLAETTRRRIEALKKLIPPHLSPMIGRLIEGLTKCRQALDGSANDDA